MPGWFSSVGTPKLAPPSHAKPVALPAPAPSLFVSSGPGEREFTFPLPRGSKSHGVSCYTLLNSATLSRRVAVLCGGQHGPYRLAETLPGAHGTYGKLRLGVDRQGTPVAVKVVRLKPKDGAATRRTPPERVLDELNAAGYAGPEHSPLDVLQVKNKVYIAMPLAGGDLFDLRQARDAQGHRMAPEQRSLLARHMLARAAEPLSRMHARGWAHLDLKLENFLWAADGTVRLTDFGLASNDLLNVGCRGTAHTMAPEVADAGRVDGRADVWSLGVTLAEMLARSGQIFTHTWDHSGKVRYHSDPKDVVSNQFVFDVWRRGLPRLPEGGIDVDSLDHHREVSPLKKVFAKHFGEVRDADHEMCEFILNHMLGVGAHERMSMRQVAATLVPHAEYLSSLQSQVAKVLQDRAPYRPDRENVLNLLHDLHRGVAWFY